MLSLLLGYLLACALVGHLGRNKKIGFWGFLAISILLTPAFGLFVLLLGMESKKPRATV